MIVTMPYSSRLISFFKLLLCFIYLISLAACGGGGAASNSSGGNPGRALSSAKEITSFSFTRAANASLNSDIVASISGDNISLIVPSGVDRTSLVASFSTMATTVQAMEFGTAGLLLQTSGVTPQNFKHAVTYVVTAADGSVKNYFVTVKNPAESTKDITAFSFGSMENPGLTTEIVGSISDTAISVTLPYAIDRSKMVPTFSTNAASVTVAGQQQQSGGTALDFTRPLVYVVNAADGSSRNYVVTVINAHSSAKELTAFSINNIVGIISENTISVTLPSGVNRQTLRASFSTTGATVKVGNTVQTTGTTENNFNETVRYDVIADDGTTKSYAVVVSNALGTSKDISRFSIQGVNAVIAGTEISVILPAGSSRKALTATFAANAKTVKVGGVAQLSDTTVNDFSLPVTYVLTAEDGSSSSYVVTVRVANSSAKELVAFSLLNVNANFSGTSITVKLPDGSSSNKLAANFASTGASVKIGNVTQVSGVTVNDFSKPQIYTVTAADGSSQDYVVTVSVTLSSSKNMESFSIQGIAGKLTESAISVALPVNTNLSALAASFTTTGVLVKVGSTPQTSGVTINNFNNPLVYTVVAMDGTTRDYVVTATAIAASSNDITSFSLAGVSGRITGTEINLSLPANANVSNLAASFTSNGVLVRVGSTTQLNGITLNNFSVPVIYSVIGADGSVKSYTVKVQVGSSPASPRITSTLDGNILKARFNPSCVTNSESDFIDALPLSAGKIYPEDCAYAGTNPPVLQWPVGKNNNVDTGLLAPWSITINKSGQLYLSGSSKYPHFQITSPLPNGDYEWFVSFKKPGGTVVKSSVRRFSVNGNAATIPAVKPEDLVLAVKKRSHPRSLPKDMTKQGIVANLQLYASAPHRVLLQKAASIAGERMATEPPKKTKTDFATTLEFSDWLKSVHAITTKIGIDLSYLAYVATLTDDARLKRVGIERLLALATWDVNGSTEYAYQDQAARQMLQTLARGYDYFYNDLTPTERRTVSAVIAARYGQMQSLLRDIHKNKMDSHGVTNVSFLVNVLMLLAGDDNFHFADEELRNAYDSFLAISTALGGDDGAFINGNGYGWYVANLLDTLVTIKTITGYDLSSVPYYAKYVDYLMAFTAPLKHQLMVPFGDDHTLTNLYSSSSHSTLQPYALFTRNNVHQWYFNAYRDNISNPVIRPMTYFHLTSMGVAPVVEVRPAQHSWFFPEAGLASLTSNGADPERSSIAFRSSKSGAYNHSYADQNSFTMVSKGKDMLISSGYYFRYGSPHHNLIRSTRFHNALTFDGGTGQSEPVPSSTPTPSERTESVHSTDASGELYNAADVNNIAIVTGNAAKAYRRLVRSTPPAQWTPLLSNAVRSIAYFRTEQVTVIYDWATSATARSWELNFHALLPFQFDTPGMARLVSGGSSICFTHHNFPSTMRMTDQFAVPPDSTTALNQYHLRSTANAASQELTAITVIRENCSAQTVDVNVQGTKAQVMLGVKGVEFDKKRVSILAK